MVDKIGGWLIVALLYTISLWGVDITQVSPRLTLLPHTQLYLDDSRSATIEEIKKKKFVPTDQEHIGYGYSPDFDVWVKVALQNPSSKPQHLLIEYTNPLIADIRLYDGETQRLIGREGLLHASPDRKTLNPYFDIFLESNSTRTYYLKASSGILALALGLDLWRPRAFYSHAVDLRASLSLFFGAMFIIILYNLIIYFIVREISYLYYVLFFAFVTLHQFSYRGVLAFTLPEDSIRLLIEYATFIVALPVLFLMLFTKEMLHLKQYPKVNRFMSVLLLFYPTVIVLVHLLGLDHLRAALSVSMLFALFVITGYALAHKNQQAKYLIVGWALFWAASLMMYLSNTGIYDISSKVLFFTEKTLVVEALIFAFSLAMMIKQANQEKLDAQAKYILLQTEKEQHLTQKVQERTSQLVTSLEEKDILLKELNHRVKNSIQTIVSFLRLQIDDTEDEVMRRALTHVENRILSINHLYALLNTKENLTHIDARTYFALLVATIQKGFGKKI